MTREAPYDLAIVGSGSAAFAAAIEARRRGATVVMIEHGLVGGTCVNVGCVPSKALLAAAAVRHEALAQRFPGVATTASPVDMAALVAGKDELVDTLRAEKYLELADVYGFTIRSGHTRFVTGPALEVDGERLEAANFVIATGATPSIPLIEGLDDVDYLTSTSAMALERVPASVLVIGANAVGLEAGQLLARLGATVTIIEAQGRIAPFEEPAIAEVLTEVLTEEGISVRTDTSVQRVARSGDGVLVTLATHGGVERLQVAAVLVATGRRPVSADLGLRSVGVEVGARGEVVVNDELRTSNPRIFAAGDVAGLAQFVYVAGKHGAVAAANAIDSEHRTVDYTTMPRVTFTSPAIASVGLTEKAASEQGLDYEVSSLPLAYVPRAIVNRDVRGLVKIVAERESGRVLGVHVLADQAGEVIAGAVYAMEAGRTVTQLAEAWTPYLTMAEAIKLAAQSFSRDVATLSCCAS
ncbi:MAG: mercury(II) reductase [Acidimicrobiales bacterium]